MSLSDGQLAYLAFVALSQLPGERSILCFDEIELHMHPGLLVRVMALMEKVAEHTPVLLTTHSRRVLDELSQPANSVVALVLNGENLQTEALKFEQSTLQPWLEQYDGLGRLLDAGYQESFLAAPSSQVEGAQ
jgi:predicted ATPase